MSSYVLELTIPAAGTLRLQHLVLDFNGTLACDGVLLQSVRARIDRLSEQLQVHVVAADTFGTARDQLRELPCEITLLPAQEHSEAKCACVERINPAARSVSATE